MAFIITGRRKRQAVRLTAAQRTRRARIRATLGATITLGRIAVAAMVGYALLLIVLGLDDLIG